MKRRGMIAGVKTKELKVHVDDRGFLMEMLRADDPLFEGFGQVYVTCCRRGVAKAWHYHKEQTDHFVCLAESALVVLYDGREDSPTKGQVEEYILEAPPGRERAPLLLKIPPLVVHGFTALTGAEAWIVNIPTLPYRYRDPDEFRYPWDSPAIPYRWPAAVTRGA